MRNELTRRREALKKTLAGIFVMLTLVGSGTLMVPQRADAIFGIGDTVFDPSNFLKNTITAAQEAVSSGFLGALHLKEFTLDGIAWSLAKKVLAQSVASVVDWINSGFNGKPAFITDYDKYFLNAADEAAGDFIQAANFGQLCQPLQTPVRFILDLSYRQARDYRERSQCTLTSAVGNMQNFVNGNFREGGWTQWFSVVSNPANNIYGATAQGRASLRDSVDQNQKNAKIEEENGHGFLSQKNCSSGKCVIVTPGSVISEYLNFSLTVGDRVLIQADQINEVVGALFSQLGKQAITGANGLLGLSYSSDGTSPSYVSQFSNETATFGAAANSSFLTDALKVETQYLNIFVKATSDLDVVVASVGGLNCPAGDKVAADAGTLQATYDNEATTTQSIIDILNLLIDNFNATSDASIKTVIVEQFQKMQGDGTLHTTTEVTEKSFSVADDVTKLRTSATSAANSCK